MKGKCNHAEKEKKQTLNRTPLHYSSRLPVSDLLSLLSAIDAIRLSEERDEKKKITCDCSSFVPRFECSVCSCSYIHISCAMKKKEIKRCGQRLNEVEITRDTGSTAGHASIRTMFPYIPLLFC